MPSRPVRAFHPCCLCCRSAAPALPSSRSDPSLPSSRSDPSVARPPVCPPLLLSHVSPSPVSLSSAQPSASCCFPFLILFTSSCALLPLSGFTDFSVSKLKFCSFQRCPLGSTILKVKLLDMGEPRALLATALSPPSLSDIERTILLLKEVGPSHTCSCWEELRFLGRIL